MVDAAGPEHIVEATGVKAVDSSGLDHEVNALWRGG
jgi:hypothetical protein